MLQTEHEFTLPMGILDEHGELHRDGVMRLATAADEILPLRDPRVQKNPAYLTIILLSRVLTRLGPRRELTPKDIEGLFSADLAYLQQLYNEVNRLDGPGTLVACPDCQREFEVEPPFFGGIDGYPLERLYEELAFIAYYFHWPADRILDLEHADRHRWAAEISRLNERVNAAGDG